MTPYQTTPLKATAQPLSAGSTRSEYGGAGPSEVASLGIITKYPPMPNSRGFTGGQKYERYALQSAARLSLPTERVAKCLRVPTSSHSVDIHKTIATETYHYQNLRTCGSVWHCPCCAAKISEKRKSEVQRAITAHETAGGQVYLLTVTLPHRLNQHLKTVLGTLLKAHTAFEKDRVYREGFKTTSGLVGRIRGLEVTYGANGWHPHLHLLLFVNRITNIKTTEHDLLSIWKKVVVKQGFDEPNHHGLTLENGQKAAKYVGKWGLEHELTKSHIKRSREGYTPFDLLRVMVGTYEGSGQNVDVFEATSLFREYGKIFKGRRQLVWSNGLRDRFNLGIEKTDEEIADQVDEETSLFAKLPLSAWRLILSKDKRGEVLSICQHGLDALHDFIIDIMESEDLISDT